MLVASRTLTVSLLSAAATLAGAALFLYACFVTASDAQGAVVFVFLGPVVAVLFLAGWALGRHGLPAHAPAARPLAGLAAGGGAFVLVFFVSAYVEPLRPFAEGVIGAVAAGHEALTGISPGESVRRARDVRGMILEQVARSGGARLDLSALPTRYPWDRVCVFAPRTDPNEARRLLDRADWDITRHGQVADSARVAMLVFQQGREVVYVVELQRGNADLTAIGRRCFTRAGAVFERKGPPGTPLAPVTP